MVKDRLNKLPQNTNEVEKMVRDMIDKYTKATPFEKFTIVSSKDYEEFDNSNEPILYIVLNKDAIIESDGIKYAIISHLTSLMASKEMGYRNTNLWNEWLDSFGGYGNTVVLEATEDEIYTNCMSHYDNVEFVKYIEDSSRVAHHNWCLDIPQHLGLAFFGIKKEMPKWLRRLPLAK